MPNTIRTPKRGNTEHSRAIAEAVDDQAWQEFRLSLKGLATVDKLARLREYFASGPDVPAVRMYRVRNYLGALARGGQIRIEHEFSEDFSHVVVLKDK